MKTMHSVAVQIVRFVNSDFPGWVECELVDTAGRRHILKDKVPIFTAEDLNINSKYPTQGFVACEVVQRYQNEKGQELVRVSTHKPYDIESAEGLSEFTVSASLVSSTD
jgi:hypothetical protein